MTVTSERDDAAQGASRIPPGPKPRMMLGTLMDIWKDRLG
jgi:hypothetical protein